LARVENDDVLDMRIGTYRTLYHAAVDRSRRSVDVNASVYTSLPPLGPNEVRSVCDDPLVPPAPPTSNRYIIH
jgi:hypothetical protein